MMTCSPLPALIEEEPEVQRLWFDQGVQGGRTKAVQLQKARTYYVAETSQTWVLCDTWPPGNLVSEWKLRGPDAMSRP